MRRRLGPLLTAALGGAVMVLPAVAGSETGPTITAENLGGGIYGETHAWTPAQVTVAQGATVTLSNPTEVRHGVEWVSTPATPTCDGGVPVGNSEAAAGTKWSGACTFTTPGVYIFYCTVHHSAMTGRVTVAADGTTTTTTTTTTTPTPTTTASAPSDSGANTTGTPGSPLAGSAASSVKLRSSQHGKSVRGSVAVSAAGAGGRLEVDLLAGRASLARMGHQVQARVGKLVRTMPSAGEVPFAVPLNARAKAALLHRRHLALTVKVAVKPINGAVVTVTRAVVLHP